MMREAWLRVTLSLGIRVAEHSGLSLNVNDEVEYRGCAFALFQRLC